MKENKTEGSKLVAALVKAQAKMEGAKKDSENPHFRSKYADLASVVDAIKPVAEEFGLAYFQRFHDNEGGIAIETIILHESGEQLSNGVLRVPATKQDAQGYGSAITYARRYSLQTAFGIAPEEDDGNAAAEAKKKDTEKKALEKVKADAATASKITGHVNGWVTKMVDDVGSSVELCRGWWDQFGSEVVEDCGKVESEKVRAAWVATGKRLVAENQA